MKTREELEKMFFDELNLILRDIRNHDVNIIIREKMVNKFIFETIIPEVLNSIIPTITTRDRIGYYSDFIEDIKQKAKEQFGIEL